MKIKILMFAAIFAAGIVNLSAQKDGIAFYIDILDIVNSGKIKQAQSMVDSLEQACEDTSAFNYAILLSSKAKILAAKHKWEKAISLRKKAVKIAEALNKQDRAMAILYADLGFAMREQGNFGGLDYYQKANEIFRKTKKWGSLAQSYNTIFPFFKDEIDASGSLYFTKLALYYFHKANPQIDSANAKTLIFNSSFIQGVAEAFNLKNMDSAAYYHQKALDVIKTANHPHAIYYKYLGHQGVAGIFIQQKKFNKAKKHINGALKYFEKLGMNNTPYHAHLLLYRGIAYRGTGELDSAENYIQRALNIYTQTNPKFKWRSSGFRELSKIAIKRENFQKALGYVHQAMYANSPTIQPPEDINSILPMDSAYFVQSHYGDNLISKAHINKLMYEQNPDISYLENSYKYYSYYADFVIDGYYKNTITLDRVSEIFNKDIQKGLKNYLIVADEMYKKTNDKNFIKKAYNHISVIKAGLLQEQTDKTLATTNQQYLNLKQTLGNLKKKIKTFNFIRRYENISTDSLETIHHLLADVYIKSLQTRKKMDSISNAITDSSKQTDFEIHKIMAEIDENQAIVDYFYTDSTLSTFAITNNNIELTIINADDLDNEIQKLKRYLKTGSNRLDKQSQKLYSKLIDPVNKQIMGKKQLTVIPYGALYEIPLEVLKDRQDEYLVANHSIAYNFSATRLKFKETDQTTEPQKFLGYAPEFKGEEQFNMAMRDILLSDSAFRNISIFEEQKNNITPLPFAKEEVSDISRLFEKQHKTANIIVGSEATETHFKTNYSGQQIIHIASHGYASQTSPELSGVFFYDSNEEDNGYLFLSELQNLKLDADLVVLSACQSGKGQVRGIEGSISLPRGFAAAGAKNVIGSLWKVHDQRTKELMVAFYSHLLENKISYAEALRLAKLECIEKGFLPMDWSGFVLVGD